MGLADARVTPGDSAGGHSATGEPSVSSAIEHLVASSQGEVTKRIDLALLEGRELLSRTLHRAALVVCGMVLAAGAWFAVAACVVLLIAPNASLAVRLAAFGLLNAGGAAGFVTLAMRRRPPTPPRATGHVSGRTEKP